MRKDLYKWWVFFKPITVIATISVPFIVIAIKLTVNDEEIRTPDLVVLLFIQTGFLIGLAVEQQKTIDGRLAVDAGGVYGVSNNPIWGKVGHSRLQTVDLIALNGGRIVKCIFDCGGSIGILRAIYPSEKALEIFFTDLPESERRKRISTIDIGFGEFLSICELLKKSGRLESVSIKKVDFFTQNLFVYMGDGNAIFGNYYRSPDREASTGIKAETRIETRSDLIAFERRLFDRIWDSYSG